MGWPSYFFLFCFVRFATRSRPISHPPVIQKVFVFRAYMLTSNSAENASPNVITQNNNDEPRGDETNATLQRAGTPNQGDAEIETPVFAGHDQTLVSLDCKSLKAAPPGRIRRHFSATNSASCVRFRRDSFAPQAAHIRSILDREEECDAQVRVQESV